MLFGKRRVADVVGQRGDVGTLRVQLLDARRTLGMGERSGQRARFVELKLVRNCRAHQGKTAGRQCLFCIGCMSDTFNAAAEFKATIEGAYIDCSLGDGEQRLAARRGGRDDGLLTNGRKSGAFNVKTNDGSKARERLRLYVKAHAVAVVAEHGANITAGLDLGMAIVVAGCGKAKPFQTSDAAELAIDFDAIAGEINARPVTRRNAVFALKPVAANADVAVVKNPRGADAAVACRCVGIGETACARRGVVIAAAIREFTGECQRSGAATQLRADVAGALGGGAAQVRKQAGAIAMHLRDAVGHDIHQTTDGARAVEQGCRATQDLNLPRAKHF